MSIQERPTQGDSLGFIAEGDSSLFEASSFQAGIQELIHEHGCVILILAC